MTTLYSDETNPDILLAWYDNAGVLRNFTGWTLAIEIVDRTTGELESTKTTGLTGGTGTGATNVNIAFSAAELAALLPAGGTRKTWRYRPIATNGTERAVFTINTAGALPELTVIGAPVAAVP